jgi:hypothetical protein
MLWVTVCASMDQMLMVSSKSGLSQPLFLCTNISSVLTAATQKTAMAVYCARCLTAIGMPAAMPMLALCLPVAMESRL